ncbi:ExeA family protein [Lacibacterium aquatile]|uniref:ExeA family protein n=1 Tax=Lacibacterium aquatile TaxID=1168082 RepID=A0ABW5DWQ8_9PROT
MYEAHFGLSGKPFALVPDPDLLYPSRRHRRALALLEYGLSSGAAFAVITGEVGAGKTTLLKHFLRTIGPEVTVGLISNTHASLGDVLDWVTSAFDLSPPARDPATLYNHFVDFVLQQYAEGRRTMLFVDEAQNIGPQMLEKLRMLSNINSGKDLLLQIVLIGQPELLAELNRPDLRQFAQRISISYHLGALDAEETAGYVLHRLSKVGGRRDIFTADALAILHYFTGGVPRLINNLADLALVYAFGAESAHVDGRQIIEVVADRQATGLSPFLDLPMPSRDDSLRVILRGEAA